MNKKGIVPIVIIIIFLVLIVLVLVSCKKLKDERDICLSNLTKISKEYENLKKQCNAEIQELNFRITELKENNTILSEELDKYKTNVLFTQAKIGFPFVNFPIKVYLIMLILSFFSILAIFSKIEFNIKLEEYPTWIKVIIWITILLNALSLLLGIYALIIDIFKI